MKRNGKNASRQEVEAAPQDNVARHASVGAKVFIRSSRFCSEQSAREPKGFPPKAWLFCCFKSQHDKCQLTSRLLPLHHLVEGVAVEVEANLCRSWPPKGMALFLPSQS